MPLTGIEKSKHNVISYRIAQQKEYWPSVVKELDEKSNGVRFRSEILSYTDLFNIYMYGIGDDITPEDESRGRKKSKIDKTSEVIPSKAFELPGRFSDRTEYHTGRWGYLNFDQWLYARDQARKDLYWLCKEVFDMDVQPHVHKVICDQFVTKNFDGVYKEGYRLKEDFQAALSKQSRVPHVWVQTSEYEPRTLGDFGRYIPDPIESEKFTNYARTMVLLEPRGHFKALDVDTLIPTPNGFLKMGELKIGDKVFDETGRICSIIGCSPVYYNRPCYEVVFSTGEKIVADANHLWETESRRDRDTKKKVISKIRTTEEIAKTLFCRKERNHRIRVASPIDCEEKILLISPYVLGVWLGDGTSSNSNITSADSQVIEEIRKEGQIIREAAYQSYLYITNGGPEDESYRKHSGNLASKLRILNLLNNKHIPEIYLRASFKQRLALLQGLMDSDGTVTLRGDCVFSNTNEKLIKQVRELIASLGFKPSKIRNYQAQLNGNKKGVFYTLNFKAYADGTLPFRLLRKLNRLKPKAKVSLQNYRQIIDVKKVESRPVKCIAVDSPSKLYLAGEGFIPTHNSSIDAADAIQWIINCPDIRILIVAGVKKLGEQFLAAVKQGPKQPSFYLPKGVPPSPFQLLFPEFVVRGVDGTSSEPLRVSESCAGRVYKISKFFSPDPTIGVISVGSSLSGFHCDVLKCDDIVTDENCNTNETREAILLKADGAVNMLMPWGWHDIIGTRYFPDDYYGLTEKAHLENPETFNLKYFCRPAWIVKDEYKHIEEKSIYDLTEEMVILTFPELAGSPHATWLDLQKKLRKNERSFRTQQLNQPVWGELNSINFERGLLEVQRNKTLAEVMAAKPDYIYGAIDLARENKQYSDFSALAVGKIYQEGASDVRTPQNNFSAETEESRWILVILDVEFGKWTQTEIANRIAKMNDKWRPKAWHGEDPGGLELLKERIIEVSKVTYGHWPYIRWVSPENSENAKRNRIKGLELLLRNKRLSFLTAPWNNEVFEQLERYKGQKSSRYFKDDVPDVISQLTRFIPSLVVLSKKDLEQQAIQKEAEYREYLRREMRRVIFGDDSGGFVSPVNTEQPMEEPKPVNSISKKYFGNSGLRF